MHSNTARDHNPLHLEPIWRASCREHTHRLLDTLSKCRGSTYRTSASASTAASVSGCSSPRTATTMSGMSGFVAASEHASLCDAEKASRKGGHHGATFVAYNRRYRHRPSTRPQQGWGTRCLLKARQVFGCGQDSCVLPGLACCQQEPQQSGALCCVYVPDRDEPTADCAGRQRQASSPIAGSLTTLL